MEINLLYKEWLLIELDQSPEEVRNSTSCSSNLARNALWLLGMHGKDCCKGQNQEGSRCQDIVREPNLLDQ